MKAVISLWSNHSPHSHYLANRWVHCLAVASCISLSWRYCVAILPTSGSSVSKEPEAIYYYYIYWQQSLLSLECAGRGEGAKWSSQILIEIYNKSQLRMVMSIDPKGLSVKWKWNEKSNRVEWQIVNCKDKQGFPIGSLWAIYYIYVELVNLLWETYGLWLEYPTILPYTSLNVGVLRFWLTFGLFLPTNVPLWALYNKLRTPGLWLFLIAACLLRWQCNKLWVNYWNLTIT